MIYIMLIIEFVKISLFSFGGGYGTLPFIYYLSNHYGWYGTKEIMHMVAVAAVTPGAFGVNMATYTGYKTAGVVGSIVSTAALIIPSFILTIMVYKALKKYRDSQVFQDFLETLRAVASGLLFAVVLQMLNQEIFHVNLNQMTIDFSLNTFEFLVFSTLVYFLVRKNVPVTMLITLIFGTVLRYFSII